MDREQYFDAYNGAPEPEPTEAPAAEPAAEPAETKAEPAQNAVFTAASGDSHGAGRGVPPPYAPPYPRYAPYSAARQPQTEEKDPARRRLVIFGAVTLAVCLLVSAVTGAASSFLTLKLYSVLHPVESTTEENTYVPEITAAQPVPGAEQSAAPTGQATPEKTTAAGTAPAPASSSASTAAAAEKRGKTKGEIYAASVGSIVSVEAKGSRTVQSMFGFGAVQTVTSSGSGFFYSADGYIVTNYHVVEGMESYSVTTYEGKKYDVTLRGYDAANDIAVLKAEGSFTPVTLGSSASLRVGDDVLVIGNALGELSFSFTDGVVSYLSRFVTGRNGRTIRMFQTNAAINEGNSGGPVFNMEGEVVGIASAKYASETIEGLGFCTPIDDVKSKIHDIVSNGYVTDNPLLGVSVQTVTGGISMRYNLPVGCYVVECEAGSAAADAGIAAGDVLTGADGYTLASHTDLAAVLSSKKAGQTVELTFVRNGAEQTVTATLGASTNAPPRTNYSNVFDY